MSQLKVNAISDAAGANGNAITLASDGTCTAKITNNLSNRNLIINGAMLLAQRATTSTADGYKTVDRWQVNYGGENEVPTQAQVALTTGSPYDLGFRKVLKVTNGNQTSGAGATDYARIRYKLESQDLASSGWNYKSASSYITLSFWVKSSVAQNFYVQCKTSNTWDGNYVFETGSLSADTWTKITHSIPGNSNLVFDNAANEGIYIAWHLFRGTDNTGAMSLNTWAAENSSLLTPDQTSTWWTTNDATYELTGVQLEVGDVATDFEHRSYSDELARCQRYYQQYVNPCCTGVVPDNGSKAYSIGLQFQTRMRAVPTLTITNAGDGQNVHDGSSGADIASLNAADRNVDGASIYLNLDSDLGDFRPATLGRNDQTTNTTTYKFSTEL